MEPGVTSETLSERFHDRKTNKLIHVSSSYLVTQRGDNVSWSEWPALVKVTISQ